jgi:large subunit ribosomal protein L18
MKRIKLKTTRWLRRKKGIRKRVLGADSKPRLSVYRSSKHIYAQLIDDLEGRTLASASSVEKGADRSRGGGCAGAKEVGGRLAERAKAAGIETAVFDRNGFRYHGRIRALAEGCREGGLKV